jgi:hypothetical protein
MRHYCQRMLSPTRGGLSPPPRMFNMGGCGDDGELMHGPIGRIIAFARVERTTGQKPSGIIPGLSQFV